MVRPLVFLLAAATALAALPLAPLAPASAAATTAPLRFGMDAASMQAEAAAGVPADYGTFWIGPWTLSSGWGGPDAQMDQMAKAGVTPAIHLYYFGDAIAQTCFDADGCWSSLQNTQLTMAGWQTLTQQLTDHLNAHLQGKPAVVLLETEFNKGDVAAWPPLDQMMADKVAFIHGQYPAAQVVMPLGNWGSGSWGTWQKFGAAVDLVGLQGMRGSTRDSLTSYLTLYEATLAGVQTAQSLWHKPILLDDIALSSYPEPSYLASQHDSLAKFFTNLGTLKADGVMGMIYRSWLDSPTMDTANYYGMAERYWGVANAAGGKPAQQVWVAGVQAERAGLGPAPTPSPTPASAVTAADGTVLQAESFATKTSGGAQADAAADGGTMWDLWSNGDLAQAVNASQPLDATVRVRGTTLAGVGPHMLLSVGGAQVLAADPGTAYTAYTVAVPAGTSELRIDFTNDARSATEDRNLIVDTVTFAHHDNAPTAALALSTSGLSVTADGSGSSDPDGDALTYTWSFGDGATATGAQASHAYAAAGTYTVTLTVSDGTLSAQATAQAKPMQPNRAPMAAFTATSSNLAASFDGSASSDPDGNPLTYTWSFGDGASGTGVRANHTYAAAGTFTVQLTVSDGSLSASATKTVTATAPVSAPTPTPTPASTTGPDHVVVVLMENHNRSDIVGNAAAPYLNSLAAAGVDYADMVPKTHPSLPNYLDLYSGSTQGQDGLDACVRLPADNLGNEAALHGVSLKVYAESLGTQAPTADHSPYACRHNPAAQFTDAASTAASVDLSAFPANLSQLPRLSFVIPNLCSDMHDCSIATGDAWLKAHLSAYQAWAATHNAVLVVFWDENAGTDLTTPMPAFVVGAGVAHSVQTGRASEENLLRTLEDWFGLPRLGGSASAAPLAGLPSYGTSAGTTTGTAGLTANVAVSANVNAYWVEVGVTSAAAVQTVEASVAGGAWTALPKDSWGTYAKSVPVPKGTMVAFRVTDTGGRQAVTSQVAWLVGTPTTLTATQQGTVAPTPSPTPSPAPATFAATFAPKAVGNDWWVETAVSSTSAIAKVEASLNGGAWTALPKDSWGTYAASLHAPNGTVVQFRATSTAGGTALSAKVTWT